MDATRAGDDLRYIREVLERTRRRIDPHAFHFVHWGAIVMVGYPAMNWLALRGDRDGMIRVGAGALLLGFLLSTFLEWRLSRRPRLPGEDTFVSRQVATAVFAILGAAGVLTGLAPATGFIEGPAVPVIWGLAYAAMAFAVGLVYDGEYFWSAGAIFLGSLAAMALPEWNGFILGPVMGLGMIVPGIRAEMRVRRLAREAQGAGPGE